MTPQIEIAELSRLLAVQHAEIKGELELIKLDLAHVKIQTTKTNGTVIQNSKEIKSLQDANLIHYPQCPLNTRLEIVEKTQANDSTSRRSVWNFVKIVAAVVVGAIAFAVSVKELILK
jgi:hypothetical protein